NVFDDARILTYEFFYYQRDGCEVIDNVVPGYIGHAASHLDDASYENGTYRDVHGGWFDAGDYNKYNGFTPLSVLALIDGYLNDPNFFSSSKLNNTYPNSTGVDYHGNFPDILEEAIWGADYLVRCTYDSGFMTGTVGSNEYHGHYGFWGPPDAETDNDPATFYDNRRLHEGGAGKIYALQGALALLKIARTLETFDKFASRVSLYREKAEKIFDYYAPLTNDKEPIKALINWELFLVNGTLSLRDKANEIGLANIQNPAMLNWNSTSFGHVGVDFNHACILQWALLNGSQEILNITRQRIQDRWNNFWEPYYKTNDPANYFNILKGHITYREFDENNTEVYRSYDEYFYDRFRDNRSDWNVGQNSYYLCAAWANALAFKITNDSRHLYFAMAMFDWIFGKNPFALCMVEGEGTFNPPRYHNRASAIPGNPYGKVPGCVPNGITRKGKSKDDPDLSLDYPYFDLKNEGPIYYGADYSSTEPWLPHNAYFVLAMNAFINATS
ncbi:MAG: glycoside hydrolase family 9 protein, partial [Promethearchaeota archaeon]